MHHENLDLWQHQHAFGQHVKRPGENPTLIVIVLTALTMVVEIVAGILFGSMALLADGLHMASHAVALGISAMAYIYARRHAHDERFSFGTGKINALAGFTGAVLLAVFALMMAWESVARLIAPVPIAFNQAIAVAVLGLMVNGISVWVLDHKGSEHAHEHAPHDEHKHHHHEHDHNLKSAYFHVLADALTSLLAIFALLTGKFFGASWTDPAMGLVGAILVSRWALGLLRSTSGVLVDRQAPAELRDRVRLAIERQGDDRLADLHLWSVGPGIYALELTVVTHHGREPDYYKALLPADLGVVHATVEVQPCPAQRPEQGSAVKIQQVG